MTYARWIRVVLGYFALSAFQSGAWALFAPRSFYGDFPGMGNPWISIDGPYNEHFIRDFGALNLALLVLFLAAAITLSRSLVTTAALAAMVWGVPHVVYHLRNTGELATTDIVMSLVGLTLFAALPVAVLVLAPKLDSNSEVGKAM